MPDAQGLRGGPAAVVVIDPTMPSLADHIAATADADPYADPSLWYLKAIAPGGWARMIQAIAPDLLLADARVGLSDQSQQAQMMIANWTVLRGKMVAQARSLKPAIEDVRDLRFDDRHPPSWCSPPKQSTLPRSGASRWHRPCPELGLPTHKRGPRRALPAPHRVSPTQPGDPRLSCRPASGSPLRLAVQGAVGQTGRTSPRRLWPDTMCRTRSRDRPGAPRRHRVPKSGHPVQLARCRHRGAPSTRWSPLGACRRPSTPSNS